MEAREKDRYILEEFVGFYCRQKHHTLPGALCPDCAGLLAYAERQLSRCRQDPRPACKDCPVHCYAPAYRERIREVMRYSGMRLILRGRLDLLAHYLR